MIDKSEILGKPEIVRDKAGQCYLIFRVPGMAGTNGLPVGFEIGKNKKTIQISAGSNMEFIVL